MGNDTVDVVVTEAVPIDGGRSESFDLLML